MPERLAPVYEERTSYFVPALVTLVALLAVGFGIYAYIQGIPIFSKPIYVSPYRTVYEQLGVSTLPPQFERAPEATRYLDQLRREPCDREAIIPLAKLMVGEGYPREGARSSMKFGERCGYDGNLLEGAYAALMRVGDTTGAVAAADEMIKLDPARGRYRFLRGTAYESLKNYKAALSDYISTLQLFTDLSNVAPSEFYRISRMYDAVGRPCEAITPLEMYLSYNVAQRQTAQLSQMVTEYANRGNCRATHATGSDRIVIAASNIVDVTINGARGRMIVDTGASMVSLTPAFASRARILPDENNLITFQVVGGTIQSAPGYAQLIEVGKARAANVPVAVAVGNNGAFGQQVDGLLGMTFLARFNIAFSSGALELKPRVLN
jgi:clan AA aspartic protease (TIGR02281 family)